jgi:glycosyltransferase involved in cell wall biosynthesis
VRVAYVLPEPELNGGNKVVGLHAALLAAAGVEVTVLAAGPRPEWFPHGFAFHDLGAGAPGIGAQDLVVATFWTTLELARSLALGPVAHFCQGYEGDLEHLAPQREAIAAAYAVPCPTFTVSPALAARLERDFDRAVRVVPPPVDPLFRPALRLAPRRRPRVFVAGIFESPVKDVPTALRALARLRGDGLDPRLVRLSILPLTVAEQELFAAERYLRGEPPRVVAAELRRCDLLLMTSRPGEGFGLPLLEAMACGVPVVASRLPATEWMAEGAARLVEPGDERAFAAAARELLTSPVRWRAARRAGRRAATRFAPRRIQPILLEAARWAAAVGSPPAG